MIGIIRKKRKKEIGQRSKNEIGLDKEERSKIIKNKKNIGLSQMEYERINK